MQVMLNKLTNRNQRTITKISPFVSGRQAVEEIRKSPKRQAGVRFE